MLSLRSLGALDLTADDGRSLQSVLSQPRRAAVLAYLAAARPFGAQRRDRLLPLLWPESDEPSARHSLSEALYRLRRRLGPDAIEGTGHSVLRLNDDVVKSDVRAFDKAISERRWADALDLYRGEFLCGFHLSGAPGFERWVDAERERLRGTAADAAWQLAADQIGLGSLTDAERTARRAVDLGPTDEDEVVRFVEALAAAGDRAGAIHFYERWAAALEAELEISPAPETTAAVRKLRSDPAPDRGEAESGGGAPPGPVEAGTGVGPAPVPTPVPSAAGAVHQGSESSPDTGSASRGWPGWRAAGLVVALAAITALVLLPLAFLGSRAPTPRLASAVEVAGALAAETEPAWSPDGQALAYESDQAGNLDIWVTRLGTGQAVNLTADWQGDDWYPRWSPDGRWILFCSLREGGGYFIMPAVGGTPRRVAPLPAVSGPPWPAEWSPDGMAIAYFLRQGTDPWIEIRTLADGTTRRLRLPVRPRNNAVMGLRWSPNGRFLAYQRGFGGLTATAELWLTAVSDGKSIQLTDGTVLDGSPSWSPDGRELYFVSDRGGGRDLWRFEIGESGRPEGPPEQVTAGMELVDAQVAPDGRKLAFTRGRRVWNAFRAPLTADRPVTWADVTQLTFDEARVSHIDVRDGRLLLSSNRSGGGDIYVMSAEGGALRPLTADPALDAAPRWSPDGQEVVFYSTRSGHRQLWVMPAAGGSARQLTFGAEERSYPAWSPDGREIVAATQRGLITVRVADGMERRLTPAPALEADWSPDGRWVVYWCPEHPTSTESELRLVPLDGGEEQRLTLRWGVVPRWSPDGEWIYFVGIVASADTVWAVALDSREERPITALSGRPGHLGSMGLAVDREYVYFTWQEPRGDIWVADLVPPEGR